MYRRPLHVFLLACSSFVIVSAQPVDVQRYRTIDGTQNNLQYSRWGSAGENLQMQTTVGYADGISAPGGVNRPNPRVISNALFAQEGLINDPMNLSDFCWVFGQFIDHDLSLTPDGHEPMMIEVPRGDAWFDPFNSGQVVIPMMRNLFDPATGTDTNNPRRHPNIITAYIDGSLVYGSDEVRAAWLRTFEGGRLKVSQGNMLPFNTTTGEFDAPIDPAAPHMDNPVGRTQKFYVAGDVRANENPLLLSIHTLFVREHNRLCGELAKANPEWTDEQFYQHARKIVGGLIQSIVYNEWLPTMGVKLPPYKGYRPDVNPQLQEVFTAAAFRLGHTLLNGTLRRMDADGRPMPEGHVALRDAFFNPLMVPESGGIEPFLQGMATQTQQTMDAKVIDDVRNFLFGPPGAGGLDLVSININRGRERGLPDFNTIRRNFGLQPYYFFQQISFIPETVVTLNQLYKSINNIDPWVGMLSETPMRRALFGETLMAVLTYQFAALRDGDRFFYENDPVLSEQEKRAIRQTSFHDVIMRNSNIKLMQSKVFEAMETSQICNNMLVRVTGRVHTENGNPVPGVVVSLDHGNSSEHLNTDNAGVFGFRPVSGCDVRHLRMVKEDSPIKGVTTLDLILIQKHVLNLQSLTSPYQMIAADVNNSGNISTLDIIELRKVILGMKPGFENNKVWRFVPAGYEFPDPANPFAEAFPEGLDFNVLGQDLALDYIAIKTADVNSSAVLIDGLGGPGVEVRDENAGLELRLAEQAFSPGQTVRVELTAGAAPALLGYQFGLRFDAGSLVLEDIEPGDLPGLSADNFGAFAAEGRLTTSWNAAAPAALAPSERLFTLTFRATRAGRLSAAIGLDDRMTAAAYDDALEGAPVHLAFTAGAQAAAAFTLYQNRPNPVREQTVVPFFLPEAGSAELTVFDAAGRMLLTRRADFGAGMQQWELRRGDLPAAGVCYYQVRTAAGAATRNMLLID